MSSWQDGQCIGSYRALTQQIRLRNRPLVIHIRHTVTRQRKNNHVNVAEMSRLWNFSVRVQSWYDEIESDPVLIRKIFENLSLIQSWSANVKSCIFILPHEAKELLEIFCLSPIKIGWRKNTSSSAFVSWGKTDTAF